MAIQIAGFRMNVFFLAFVLQVRADDLGLDGAKEANRKAEEAHMSFHIGSPSTVGLVRWLQCGRFLFPGILSNGRQESNRLFR